MTADTIQLLAGLQDVDTSIDRLEHRRRTAPQHAHLDEAAAAVQSAARRRVAAQTRLTEIEAGIAASEEESRGLSGTRDRLQAQLRTVIAPREAEALMHEIATISARRSDLDDGELAAMDEQERLMAELEVDEAEEPGRQAAVAAAQAELDQFLAGVDAELEAARADRAERQSGLPAPLLNRYERLRANLDGVGVARLDGRQCTGCHLELSPAEFDALRRAGPDDLLECPQCSRLLVR